MSIDLSRRRVLGRGLTLGGLALAAPAVLSACGDSGEASEEGLGTASQRLSWVMNTQFAGSYVADQRGYYEEEGFSGAELIAGGPTAPPIESDVLDRTFAGVSQVPIVGSAVAEGAPLKIIGAVYQRYAGCIISMSGAPITSIEDLHGKTIGCSSSSEPVWRNFLASVGLEDAGITTRPVQGDPIGMTEGEIDGYMGFVNNQPIDLRAQGFDVETLLLADIGFPLVGQVYITTQENLDTRRDRIKAFLRAEIRGWNDAVADPEMATDLTLGEYGADLDLDPDATHEAMLAQIDLIRTPEGDQHVGLISREAAEENIASIAGGGLDIGADDLFDLGPVEEVYEEDPDLRVS